MKFTARAPARVDPAGGGTDAPPYCLDHGGAVVNFSVARYSYASFGRLPKGSGVVLYSHDQGIGVRASSVRALEYDGRVDLLKAFVRRLLAEDNDFMLVTQSDIPQGTGLGGSGALGVAILGAIARAQGKTLSRTELALLANDIERKDLGNSGGSQDSFGAAFGGIKRITYHRGGGCACELIPVAESMRARLERDSLLIYTGEVHLSGSIHVDIRKSYALSDSPTVRAMNGLKSAAQRMAAALAEGDMAAYVAALDEARAHHYALHPSCDSDTLRRFFRELDPFIEGGKACGAGGGGFIFVHVKPDARKECLQAAERLGGMVWTCQLDMQGLTVWEEPPSSPEHVERILRRIESSVRTR